MLYSHKTPGWIQKIYPTLTWHRRPQSEKVFITFDDGPIPELTPQILDILDSYNVKATFFCVGDNVRKHPLIYRRVIDEGHAVGNHTMHHVDGWKTEDAVYTRDIQECARHMNQDAEKNRLFRPPYGKIRRKQLREVSNSYEIVMWDVLSGDFDRKLSPEDCYTRTMRHTKPGSIVVFHDNIKATPRVLHALPRVLEEIKNRNWSCGSLY